MKKKILNYLSLTIILLCSINLHAQEIKSLNMHTYEIVYSAAKDRIYASMRNDPQYGDSLCIINPYFGNVEKCIGFSDPIKTLAISPLGDLLYIGFVEAPKLIRFNLISEAKEVEIDFGSNNFGKPFLAEDMEVLPGNPNAVAVVVRAGNNQFVAVYDDDQKRPQFFDSDVFGNPNVDEIVFGEDDTKLYGKDNGTSSDLIYILDIDQQGINSYAPQFDFSIGFKISLEFQDGFLYNSAGFKLKPIADTLELAGRFDVDDPYSFNAFEVASGRDELYVLAKGVLKIINKHNFQQLKSISIPLARDDINFISAGENIFAFNSFTTQNQFGVVGILRYCTSDLTSAPLLETPAVVACKNDTIILSAVEDQPNYYWSNGSTSQHIPVYAAGSYSYRLADSNGCLGLSSDTLKLNFDTEPSPPLIESLDDTLTLCQNQSALLGIKNFSSARKYLWSTNDRSPSITVDSESIISLRVFSKNGCLSDPSEPIIIKISDQEPPSNPTIQTPDGLYICNFSPVELTASSDYSGFLWSTGDTTFSITRNYRELITLRVKDEVGCFSEESTPVFIEETYRSNPPTIQMYENLLASSAGSGNQWFLDGVLLPNEGNQFLEVNSPGNYTVQLRINGCESEMSEPIQIQ